MRKLSFLILLAVLLVTFAWTVSAARITVYDQAELLTDAERAALSTANGSDDDGVQYYLVTATAQMSSAQVKKLCGIGAEDDAVVLVIDRTGGTYYYEMFTYNAADDMISDAAADDILDASDVYSNIKSGNLQAGAKAFFDRCRSVIKAELAAEAERQKRAPLTAILVGLAVGAIAALGSVLGVFLYYRRKLHGEIYPLDRYARMNLTESQDRFVGSYVTRVRVQSNSSGGGGRSGGASGGSRGRR